MARAAFAVVCLFWIAMNALLWRQEYGERGAIGSPVAPEVVWRRVLTSPDFSLLEIHHRGERLGTCHWRPRIVGHTGDEASHVPLEGQVRSPMHYLIDIDGNVLWPGTSRRLQFKSTFQFSSDEVWEELTIHAGLDPDVWSVQASASERTIAVAYESGATKWRRAFGFEDLRNPDVLAREIAGPLAGPLLGGAGLPRLTAPGSMPLAGWEARLDRMKIRGAEVRIYRLHSRILDRHQAVIIAGRSGQILRIELPGDIVMINRQAGIRWRESAAGL